MFSSINSRIIHIQFIVMASSYNSRICQFKKCIFISINITKQNFKCNKSALILRISRLYALIVSLNPRKSLQISYKLPIVSERDKIVFSNRVINVRNSLPDNVVAARYIASFKRIINEFDFSYYLLY